VDGDDITLSVTVKKQIKEKVKSMAAPTVTLSSVYQTGQICKNIAKKELKSVHLVDGIWSGKFTFSKSEYSEKLAPDNHGLLRANAFFQFERDGKRHR